MKNLTQFIELHKEGSIRFSSSYKANKGYTLVMNDMNNEFESGCQLFDGNNVDECIEQAEKWIDNLIREDRDASERARDEQEENTDRYEYVDDGMEHPDTF